MKRTFLFATIASILSINAYAVSATVTSKDYVDAADATKQDKLPSKNVTTTIDETEIDVPSIVLYPADGENAGNVGETGFVSADVAVAKWNEIGSDEDLEELSGDMMRWLDADVRHGGVGEYAISGRVLGYAMDVIRRQKANNMVCAGWPSNVAVADRTDENCWLWDQDQKRRGVPGIFYIFF